jgi:hypothetical protein
MVRGRGMPRGAGITALSLVLALFGVLALVPAGASAKGAPKPSLEIGPFKEKGYVFDVFVSACSGTSSAQISYLKGTNADSIDYLYSGTSTCSVVGNLKRATLKLSWPGIATISAKTGAIGRLKRSTTPKGCTGGKGSSREVVLKGGIDISAAKAFGTLKSRHIKATISKISNLNCKTQSVPKTTGLFADFGQNQFLDASLAKKGRREIFLSDSFAPATGVTGQMFLDILGKAKQFTLAKGAGTLTNLKPFASGKLTLSELPVCSGSKPGAQNVTLSGAITVNSPVLGAVSFAASNASTAYVATGSAFPGECNGYGSTPLTAGIDSSCDDASVPCSISDGENDVSFEDTSNDGTQTVLSETIDFGDGSTGTLTNGSTDHTYASPGTYTATVTIMTSDGNTETASTTVYITS